MNLGLTAPLNPWRPGNAAPGARLARLPAARGGEGGRRPGRGSFVNGGRARGRGGGDGAARAWRAPALPYYGVPPPPAALLAPLRRAGSPAFVLFPSRPAGRVPGAAAQRGWAGGGNCAVLPGCLSGFLPILRGPCQARAGAWVLCRGLPWQLGGPCRGGDPGPQQAVRRKRKELVAAVERGKNSRLSFEGGFSFPSKAPFLGCECGDRRRGLRPKGIRAHVGPARPRRASLCSPGCFFFFLLLGPFLSSFLPRSARLL